jgi:hypothetical protein
MTHCWLFGLTDGYKVLDLANGTAHADHKGLTSWSTYSSSIFGKVRRWPGQSSTPYCVAYLPESYTDISYACWVRHDIGTSTAFDIPYGSYAGNNDILVWSVDSTSIAVYLDDAGGSAVTIPNIRSDGNWHHMAFSRRAGSSSSRVFIDGVYQGTSTSTTTAVSADLAFVWGQEQDSTEGGFLATQSFVGEFGMASIWNRNLSDQEIAYLANPSTRFAIFEKPSTKHFFYGKSFNKTGSASLNLAINLSATAYEPQVWTKARLRMKNGYSTLKPILKSE